ncbi:MAG: Glyoxal reductase [Candidatus Heimdallarchaeota archaeon LC_3]|nr:MAG: Glyoxal reductase [Candidatus Heimdallarchaeota archaeon LC_3]
MVLDISSTVTLNNGVKMPLFGLGLYQTKLGQETQNSVKRAFESNYRHLNRIIGI